MNADFELLPSPRVHCKALSGRDASGYTSCAVKEYYIYIHFGNVCSDLSMDTRTVHAGNSVKHVELLPTRRIHTK